MRTAVCLAWMLLACAGAANWALAGGSIVRFRQEPGAQTAKEHGDQFLSSKRYADALDSYFQALEKDPEYPGVHYNLGAVFLKGYRDYGLAAHHFHRYLALDTYAEDREQVESLLAGLEARQQPAPGERGVLLKVLGDRLLISGAWDGDPRELAVDTEAVSGTVLVAYRYPAAVLTERIRDKQVLDLLTASLAVFRAP
ncbi:MAG: tetratricopeptide repeat protein [Deferrisomatales bacterium]|nr:tetratricopeptide repeat protein [Deferrisomatales bacterium]